MPGTHELSTDVTSNQGTCVRIALTLNGEDHILSIPTSLTALQMLRGRFGLLGPRASCERAVCGACTILVESQPVAACAVFAWDLDGCTVETVEGFGGDDGELTAEQQAFIDNGSFQCGFCTSGMVTLATALIRSEPTPERERIVEYMSSNICRCTGYQMIVEAVEQAANTRQEVAE